MWPEQIGGIALRARVGRTGALISKAESQEQTHLGLSSNPVAPTCFTKKPFGQQLEEHIALSAVQTYLEPVFRSAESCRARSHSSAILTASSAGIQWPAVKSL